MRRHSVVKEHTVYIYLRFLTALSIAHIYGPVQEKGQWRSRYNKELYDLFNPLKPSGKYMYHLFSQLVTLYFVFMTSM
jgi:hypothetical protein